ncbi:SH2 domain-containing adapter protein F [Mizuhopecten yessoensis]|uniref:SH2 domain-containing adapter protein F n=1 Tax=Mizuhopecten yessoensis TaxID=6573 RepID=A0A210QKW4_MIZYE|nr:SH2 domain-containing adapter protein F [Mizuhopecten yessoensis]
MRIHKEGSYLVRRSETQKNVFSLSIKGIRGMPMHIRIGLSNGEYILGENSQPFPTVPEVIDYYTRHELPVQNAGRLRLLYPIMREKHAN